MSTTTPVIPASIPGMIPQESVIFNTWAKTNAQFYDRFDYNVRVGQGLIPDPTHTPEIQAMAIANAQKRIDAIGWQGKQPTIIEVKYRALILILGQCLGYRLLWMRDNPCAPPPALLVLCSQIDIDTMYVLQNEGIPFKVIQADFSNLPPISPG